MSLTNTWETNVGNAVLRGQTISFPSTVYVALFTSDPGESGSTADEVTGAGYARQAVTFAAPTTDGVFKNSAQISFPTAVASWGTVSHMAVMTASTGGTVICYGPILDASNNATTKSIANGDSLSIAAEALTITFT